MNRKGLRVFTRQYTEILCLLVMVSLLVGMMGPVQIAGAQGGVTVDGAVSSATADGVSSISVGHTTGTGTDRLMLVGVSANSYGGVRTISSVTFTYDTTVLTLSQVGLVENEAGRLAAIYGLLNPPSGQAGTVTVTFSGSVGNGIVAGVVNFAGVDQANPYGTYASNTGTDTTPTVNVVTTAGDLVFDTVFLGAATIGTLAAGDSQTAQWSATIDRAGGAGSIEEATGTSVTMSWTVSAGATSRFWAIVAVPIKPAAAGPTQDLTIAVSPSGGGTTVPAAGVHTCAQNAVVDITATANVGYVFGTWSGACSGTDPDGCRVTMDADKTVTANFTAIPQYDLTVNVAGNGSVTLDPAGGTYYEGTTVTLTPVPGPCYTFSGWSGPDSGDIQGTGPYTILMDGNKSVTADFAALPQYTLTAGDDGHGSVTLDPAGGTYCTGTTVTLTPVPDSGYIFDSWSGTNSGDLTDNGDGTWSITMDANKSVTANFGAPPWPTLDGAASSGTADDVDTIDIAHTTGTGTNRLMLVGVSWNCGSTDRTISSVTFTPSGGGGAITLDPVITQQAGTQLRYSAIYRWPDGTELPSGQAGTVTVTFNDAVPNGIVAGVANFAGVNQTTPLGTPGGEGSGTNDAAPTVTLTGLNGNELIFDNVFQGASGESQTLTAGSGQTQLWNAWIANTRAAASAKEAASASSVTMSWTAGSEAYWAIAAVPINPAAEVETGTIIVEKRTEPDGWTEKDFDFTGAATGSLADGEQIVVSDLQAGVYSVQEVVPAGWTLTSIVCDDGNSVVNLPNFEAEFHLEAGETVKCTFYNLLQYSVTYDGNGNTGGTAPVDPASPYNPGATVTVLGNTGSLVRTGYTFAGWNTQADGLGTSYNQGDTFVIGSANVTLYAKWTQNCYALTLGHTGSGDDPVASPANSTGCAAGTYHYGESINLSGAAADLGWGIASWYGTDNNASTANTNSLVMPASAHAAGVNYLRLLGDVNMDGLVNSSDALLVLSVDVGLPAAGYCPMNYGDVDGDGVVNSTDALIILSYDAGLPVGTSLVGQPVPEPVLSQQPPGCTLGSMGLSLWSWVPMP
ncbi:MAG: hypothetical protein GX597_08945 [Anaerolineaceae bacterium]|nr:hypothetical protein [Anaerolineaceae bacterium]